MCRPSRVSRAGNLRCHRYLAEDARARAWRSPRPRAGRGRGTWAQHRRRQDSRLAARAFCLIGIARRSRVLFHIAGAGPSGLYLAYLLKRSNPAAYGARVRAEPAGCHVWFRGRAVGSRAAVPVRRQRRTSSSGSSAAWSTGRTSISCIAESAWWSTGAPIRRSSG